MISQVMRWVFGQKMASSRLHDEKLNVFWGMPILSSDAISSVAYAVEEILLVLVPVLGAASFLWMPRISGVIILLLLILTFSYRQVVDAYPHGGGAYIVAKENLSPLAGLIAGASLSVDYTLTVAVSVCAGTAAITSAIPALFPDRVAITVGIIVLLLIGNVRGIKESSRIFAIPTYAFIFSIIALVVAGVLQHPAASVVHPLIPAAETVPLESQAVLIFLLLRAFASGCSALTGVEAVSNAVPNFKDPAPRNAKIVYAMLAAAIVVCFGGVAYLANLYHTFPDPQRTVIAQISLDVFGPGVMFYFIQATTAIILAMAANTAFAGFPTLLSVIAQHGYAPRQLALRGHRLNFNNGITILAILAVILVIVFQADTHLLIGLYAVGVFTSFTLSQTGMLVHWFRLKSSGWQYKAIINGLGALTTLIAVIIIGFTKFTEGAWIVFVVVPIIVWIMLRIKHHYESVAQQLDIPNDTLGKIQLVAAYSHHVIVPIDSLNAMVVKALRYARTMSDHVEAFHIETYEGEADKLKQKWAVLNSDIPLIIKQSPY
ncbi:MAG: APC family permease, partial [Firmicutes bacterium]|nr:APC family permease [Bacillota bacterium]